MHLSLALAGATLLRVSGAGERPDRVIADFEGADYGAWTVTGTAFGKGPAHGALPGQMAVDGFLGRGLANSFVGGDDATGTLASPAFPIERAYLRFLVGGGKAPGRACVNLKVDGAVVRTATGPNDRPGGSERLEWQQWDVRDLEGRQAVVEVVDAVQGPWGHVNVDHLVQTDRRLPGVLTNVTREIRADRRYLKVPVRNGAKKRWVQVSVDGAVQRDFEVELADGPADWWSILDISAWRGRSLTVQVDRLDEDSGALKALATSDSLPEGASLYRERLRPQFHFTTQRGWINDPNGLVYHAGEYHLFYQHNPYGWNWGNMHWGHAVSRDLVHWRELGEALYPDAQGTMFSGSAVVDVGDTTGWARGVEKPLVLMYTAAGNTSRQSTGQRFTQGLAYSTDHGRTFVKHAQNPVLPHIAAENRDPKAFWYAPQQKWVMALYLDRSDYALFSSRDLKAWERMSDVTIPGTSECPEFFEMPLGPDGKETRWVFYGGNGRYLVGRFDGTRFTPEAGPLALNHGNCFYASQTYNQLPEPGRRVLVGWGQVNLPGMAFNQMMDFPVDLTLHPTPEGPRLRVNPVREIERLRGRSHAVAPTRLHPGENPLSGIRGELFDVSADLTPQGAVEVGLEVFGVSVWYDVRRQELACQGKKAPMPLVDGSLRLRLLVDRTSIEVFGNDGAVYMPMGVLLADQPRTQAPLSVFSRGGEAQVSARVHELKSAWGR